ncbi:MAG: SDR family NAD(P)-dependent oxidoreductase [Clostridia bacterium]|nr:SDR family NAD(P)-dependent oxidoreductase [Clostridia bacterium]
MKNIAIITGASSGIGKQFAITLKDHKTYDEVWAIARNKERLDELKNEIPFPVKTISLDLSNPDSIKEYTAILEEEKPNVKTLINNSGYGKFEAFEQSSLEDNLGMIDLNCKALTAMSYVTIPYMTAGSEIINIASVAAFQPIPYINVYAATKAYVLLFSRALNLELKSKGIRVFAVCPFWTKSRFFDRAIDKQKDPIVKKYAAMYLPEQITKATWKALKRNNKDYVIPGFIATMQVFLVKLLPHKLVMNIWLNDQKLK